MIPFPTLFQRFRFGCVALLFAGTAHLSHAAAPNAVNDDLRSPTFANNAARTINEATLLANDSGDDIGIVSVSGTSEQGAAVSWNNGQKRVTYDPRNAPAFQGLAFGQTLDDTFQYTIAGSDGPNDTATVQVRVHGTNHPPEIGNFPTSFTIDDDESINPFNGATISDQNSGDQLTVTVTIDAAEGILENLGGFAADAAGEVHTFTGSANDATTALRGLRFVPFENLRIPGETHDTVLAVNVTDPGGLSDSGSVTVTVISVNDPPELTSSGPESFNVTAGSTVQVFPQAAFTDVDAESEASGDEQAGDDFTATIVVTGGSIISGFDGTGGTYAFTGKRQEVNAAIQTAAYLAPSANASFTATLTVTDSHGGVSDSVVVTVEVSQPEPALTGLVQGQQLADTGMIHPFASATFNSFGSVSRIVELTLDDDAKGFFDVLGPFTAEEEDGKTVYRMSGSAVAATTGIRNLRFRPIPNRIVGASETVTFTIEVRAAVEGTLLNAATLQVNVLPVNDAPAISSDNPEHRINDNETVSPFTTTSISDPDEGGNQTLTVTVRLMGQDPSTNQPRPGGGVLSNEDVNVPNPWVFSGTPSEVTAILQGLVFTPTPNLNQEGQRETITFTILVEDGQGGAAQNSSITVVVLAVDGAPMIDGVPALSQQPFAVAGSADSTGVVTATPFEGISVTDDNEVEPLTFVITLDNADKGTLSGPGFSSGDGGVSYSMTGMPDDVTAALGNLIYTINSDFTFPVSEPGRTQFTLQATDAAGNTTTLVFTITIRERTVAHIVSVPLDNRPDDPVIPGSLREAIGLAENNDLIVFDFPADDYPVTIRLQDTLTIEKNLTIVGSGVAELAISGDSDGDGLGDVGLFFVANGAELTVERLTLRDGSSPSYGGAIEADAGTRVIARYCHFESNEAGQFGGAIDIFEGELIVENCLFLDNAVVGSIAQGGGAISIYSAAKNVVRNSTFLANVQEGPGGLGGGALYAENSDLSRFPVLLVEHCTFSDNLDVTDSGSAILAASSGLTVQVRNNIFAGDEGVVLDVVGGGQFLSQGGNIATDSTQTTYIQGGVPQNIVLLNHPTDRRSTDPQLLPLAHNGGAPQTLGLAPSSPARNNAVAAVPSDATLAIDQRGVWRGSDPDIGAFEADEFRRIGINEIHVDASEGVPPFVEFYNPRDSESLDMDGLVLVVDGNPAHAFGSIEVAPGAGFAWTSTVALNAERGTLALVNAAGLKLFETNYVASFSEEGVQIDTVGQSINRYPRYEGGFLPHRRVVERITGIAGGDLNSAGDDVDGSPLNGGNAPPIAVADAGTFFMLANETLDLNVLLNDIEFDRTDNLQIIEVMAVSSGTAINQELLAIDGSGQIVLSDLPAGIDSTIDAAGVGVTVAADGRSLVYDPTSSPTMVGLAKGQTVTDVWAYTIRDFYETDPGGPQPHSRGDDDGRRANNIVRATAFFTVTVTGVNEPPEPQDDFAATAENHALRLLADPDLIAPAVFNFGDLDADFQTRDSEGNPITLKPLAPTTALLSNDFDVDSDDDRTTLLLVAVHTGATPTDTLVATSEKGASVSLDIRANRRETSILYDPRPSDILRSLSEGETTDDTFYYSVRDRHGARGVAKVTVAVTGVNNVPTALDIDGFATSEDRVLLMPESEILANDSDPDANDLLFIQQPLPTVSEFGAALSFDGTTVTYDPTAAPLLQALARNQSVVDSFVYTVMDGEGGKDSATAFILVEGRNDAPVAANDFLGLLENEIVSVGSGGGLLANDIDVDTWDDPWVLPQREVTTPLGARLDIHPDGSFDYDANSPAIDSLIEGEVAVEVFPYTVTDNSRLTASDDTYRVRGNREEVVLPVLLNDVIAGSVATPIESYSSAPGDLGSVVIESPNHALRDGLLVLIEGVDESGGYAGVFPITSVDRDHFSVPVPFAGDPGGSRGTWRPWFIITEIGEPDRGGNLSSPDGQTLLYTPAEDFYGVETFTYRIEDGVGGQDVATVAVEVILSPFNGFLSSSPDRFLIGMGRTNVEVDVLANDHTLPASGGALRITEVEPVGGAGGQVAIVNSGRNLSYTPPGPGFVGEETFLYTVSGGGLATAQAAVTFEVVDRTGRLSGNDDSFFVVTGSSGELLDVLANDANLPTYPMTSSLVALGATSSGGTAVIAGNAVEYTPPPSPFLGTDSFTYTATDASGATMTQTVRVQVVPAAVDFHAQADNFRAVAGAGPVQLPVLLNDGTVLNENATLQIVNLGLDTKAPPDVSRVRILPGGTMIEYIPPSTATEEIFTYEISLGTEARREATITIDVVDRFPTEPDPVDDFFRVEKNSGPHSLDVLQNDIPLPAAGWEWTVVAVTMPSQGGTVSIEGGASLQYAPAPGFFGTETFDYTIEDVFGATATATVTVDVGVLVTAPDSFAVLEGSIGNALDVLANDDLLDVFGRDYTVSAVGIPDRGGEATLLGSGPNNQILYSPATGFSGEETFTYTVIDQTGRIHEETVAVLVVAELGDRDTAELRVEITGVNDVPVIAGLSDSSTTDKKSIHPFGDVSVTDLDEWGNQLQTVIVTFSARYGRAAAPGMTEISREEFRVTGTPATVTAALRDFVFTPRQNRIDYIDPGEADVVFLVSVDDGYVTNPVTDTVTLTIHPVNDAPRIARPIDDLMLPMDAFPRAIYLPRHFSDADDEVTGGELVWTVAGNTMPGLFNSVTVDPAKQLLVLDFASGQTGSSAITVRGTDRGGLFAETTFQVTLEGPPVIALAAGATQPPAATYVSGSQSGFRRDYRHAFRVTNKGSLPVGAFIVRVSDLDEPIDGITLHAATHSIDENGTPDDFSDDATTADGVTILQESQYVYQVKYDVPLAAGESVVVHLTYRASSINSISIHPTVVIKLTTPSPESGTGTPAKMAADGSENLLLEFSVEAGRSYKLEYSSDLFDWKPWLTAIPVSDFARRLEVIDDGYNTDGHPSLATRRFYRLVDTTDL